MYLPFLSADQNGGSTSGLDTTPSPASSDDRPLVQDAWQRKFLLSIDGGGIRGLSSLFILEDLVQKIAHVEREGGDDTRAEHSFHPDQYIPPIDRGHSRDSVAGDDSDVTHQYLLCHYFDWIAGVSTGGLIAIMLGRLRMSVRDCIAEYTRFGEAVFGHPRTFSIRGNIRLLRWWPLKDKFSAKPLRNAVKRVVDERDPFSTENDTMTRKNPAILETPPGLCQTLVWAVEGSTCEQGWPFRSFHWPRADSFNLRKYPTHSFKIVDIATATAAAPTYFKPTEFDNFVFYDGGLATNNPCQQAMTDLRDYLKIFHQCNAEDRGFLGAAVSMGTGKVEGRLKPRKAYLGRYSEAFDWEKRRALDSKTIHRQMFNFAEQVRENLRVRGISDASPASFKYSRFTVGRRGEYPGVELIQEPFRHLAERIDKMAHMKMDEWISGDAVRESTVSKIRDATTAYLEIPSVQRDMIELARFLVDNRRKRSQSDLPADQRSSEASRRWYRYASAKEWQCTLCASPSLLSPLEIEKHFRSTHPYKDFNQPENARRNTCSFFGPRFREHDVQ